MEPEDKDRVDQWLDRALTQYSSGEPPAGLEGRILARLPAQPEPAAGSAPHRWLGLAVAAAATLTAVVLLERTRRSGPLPVVQQASVRVAAPTREPAPPTAPTPSAPSTRAIGAPTVGPSARPPRADRAGKADPPRGDRFPTPAPLSEQEQILVRYASEFPREAVLEARAQAELLEREQVERESQPPAGESHDPPR